MKEWGRFLYIQDESSMLDADVLAPKPGDLVLDFCAAPGGKTTHLAQKMENKGKIIAMDIHDHRLTLIEENATRLGITNIRALLHDGTKPLPGFEIGLTRFLSMRLVRGSVSLTVGQKRAGPKRNGPSVSSHPSRKRSLPRPRLV